MRVGARNPRAEDRGLRTVLRELGAQMIDKQTNEENTPSPGPDTNALGDTFRERDRVAILKGEDHSEK